MMRSGVSHMFQLPLEGRRGTSACRIRFYLCYNYSYPLLVPESPPLWSLAERWTLLPWPGQSIINTPYSYGTVASCLRGLLSLGP
eukprot:scaffold113626_cov17-Prasinocladus_malaysianus.AAC.1